MLHFSQCCQLFRWGSRDLSKRLVKAKFCKQRWTVTSPKTSDHHYGLSDLTGNLFSATKNDRKAVLVERSVAIPRGLTVFFTENSSPRDVPSNYKWCCHGHASVRDGQKTVTLRERESGRGIGLWLLPSQKSRLQRGRAPLKLGMRIPSVVK